MYLFKYIYIFVLFFVLFFCFILLFTSSSPCRKDQFAVPYFSTYYIYYSIEILEQLHTVLQKMGRPWCCRTTPKSPWTDKVYLQLIT